MPVNINTVDSTQPKELLSHGTRNDVLDCSGSESPAVDEAARESQHEAHPSSHHRYDRFGLLLCSGVLVLYACAACLCCMLVLYAPSSLRSPAYINNQIILLSLTPHHPPQGAHEPQPQSTRSTSRCVPEIPHGDHSHSHSHSYAHAYSHAYAHS